MNDAKRAEIFARFRNANPHPTTELEYKTPFELLVAVILSAQATDKSVNLATRVLFPHANTPTANVVLNTAFGQPTIAVDTHIFRVANRTGIAPGDDVREVEDRLLEVVPDE